MSHIHRRPLRAVLFTLGLLAGIAHAEEAGHVSFVAGDVTASSKEAGPHALHKGDAIGSGDTISTGSGRVQIRFSDGGMVALQPNTVFAVRSYNYANRKAEDSSLLFDLLQGGMRTITGVIGHAKHASYRLHTQVADIGIRGTEYLASYEGEALGVAVGEGSVALNNQQGSLTLIAGQAALVLPGHAPQQTNAVPVLRAPSPVSDSITAAYLPLMVREVATGQGLAYTSSYEENQNFLDNEVADGVTTISDEGGLFSAHGVSSQLLMRDGATQEADAGTDGTLNWGRWISGSPVVDGQSIPALSSVDSLHFINGAITPGSTISALDAQGFIVNYRLEGATAPTNGTASGVLNSGSLAVMFGSRPGIQLDLNISIAGMGYIVSGNSSSSMNAGAPTFSFPVASAGSGMATTGTNGACTGGCYTYVSGFFAGAQANKVGISYAINDGTGGASTVRGVAAFGR